MDVSLGPLASIQGTFKACIALLSPVFPARPPSPDHRLQSHQVCLTLSHFGAIALAVALFAPSPSGPFLFIIHVPHEYSSPGNPSLTHWQASCVPVCIPKNLEGISILPSVQGSWKTEIFACIPSVESNTRNLAKPRSFQGPISRLDGSDELMGMYPEEAASDPYESPTSSPPPSTVIDGEDQGFAPRSGSLWPGPSVSIDVIVKIAGPD